MASTYFFALAAISFVSAAFIDLPWPCGPDPRMKQYGNFCCSVGFVCLTLALAVQ